LKKRNGKNHGSESFDSDEIFDQTYEVLKTS